MSLILSQWTDWKTHDFSLRKDQVDVFCIFLPDFLHKLPHLKSLLDAEEKARADRFQFQKDHDQFVVTRAMLRILLGRYVSQAPEELRFVVNDYGKPALDKNITFNVSHSRDISLIAVTVDGALGVDVEYQDERRDMKTLAKKFLSPRELETLHALQEEQQREALFSYWSLKEALIKATGHGLKTPLREITVVLENNNPHITFAPFDIDTWRLKVLPLPYPGYIGALAVRNEVKSVRYFCRGRPVCLP